MPSTARFETQRVGSADNEARNEVSDLPLDLDGLQKERMGAARCVLVEAALMDKQ